MTGNREAMAEFPLVLLLATSYTEVPFLVHMQYQTVLQVYGQSSFQPANQYECAE